MGIFRPPMVESNAFKIASKLGNHLVSFFVSYSYLMEASTGLLLLRGHDQGVQAGDVLPSVLKSST